MVQANYNYAPDWDAAAPVRETSRVHKVKRTYRKVSVGKLLAKSGILLFIYGVTLVYLCLKASTLGYEIVQMEIDLHQMESANQRLQYEIEKKVSLEDVEKIAVNQLGMYKPEQQIRVAQAVPKQSAQPGAGQVVTISQHPAGEKTLHKIYASLVQLAGHNF